MRDADAGTRGGARHRVVSAGIRIVDRTVWWILSGIVVLSFFGELVVVVLNVLGRELFHHPLAWQLPVSQVALLPLGFFGAALNLHEGHSIKVDLVTRRMSPRHRAVFAATSYWTTGAVAVCLCAWSIGSYAQANAARFPGLSLHEGWMAVCVAGATASMALTSLLRLVEHYSRYTWYGLAPAAVVATVVAVLFSHQTLSGRLGTSLSVAAIFALLMLFLGTPIVFILLLIPSLDIILSGSPTSTVIIQLESGLSSFILVAIPFFVFAGFILTEGGLGKAIIDVLRPLVSRLPGGVLQLMLATTFVFSGLSGSKLADATAVGSSLRESLESEGYDSGECAAVLSASAAAGETIPPSIALLILGSVTTLSIATLFMAGVLPAVIISISVALIIGWRTKRGKVYRAVASEATAVPRPDVTMSTVGTWRRILGGLPALGLPIVLFGGIESGFATVTEVAAVAVVYAMVVAALSRNRLTVRRFMRIAQHSASMTGLVLLLVAAGSAMAETSALAQVPQDIASAVASLGASRYSFLLLTILIMPIAGALLEGPPAILVFAPLLVPTAMSLGLNGIHYGIVFILAFGIGTFSPLLGVGFYTTCEVLDADVGSAGRRQLPYFLAMFIALVIVAFVPEVTLLLPRWLGFRGV